MGEAKPVSLAVYRVLRRAERLSDEDLERFADGLDTLHDLFTRRNVVGMSISRAIAAGLLTEVELYAAFGLTPIEKVT